MTVVSPAVLYRRSLESRPALKPGGKAGHVVSTHEFRTSGGKRRWMATCSCGWVYKTPCRTRETAYDQAVSQHVSHVKPACPTPGKKRFTSRGVALAEVGRAWRTGRGKKLPTRVYECACRSWHMTSKPAR